MRNFICNPQAPITDLPDWVIGRVMTEFKFGEAVIHPETQKEIVAQDEVVTPFAISALAEVGCDSVLIIEKS